MASTNQTTHYDLSQYIATDKPTYLVDYNGDMNKIDTAIYGADSRSLTNESSIGTLSNLETTAKNNLVSAINELKGVSDGIGNLSNLTTTAKTDLVVAINEVDSEADTNTTAIGTLANLSTTNKTNLVGAINEVNQNTADNLARISNFNLTNFDTLPIASATTTGISSADEVDQNPIRIVTNSDYSLFKIYGMVGITVNDYVSSITWAGKVPSAYRPSTDITIFPAGMYLGAPANPYLSRVGLTIKTNGDIVIDLINHGNTGERMLTLLPCLYFLNDFGDVPPSA